MNLIALEELMGKITAPDSETRSGFLTGGDGGESISTFQASPLIPLHLHFEPVPLPGL